MKRKLEVIAFVFFCLWFTAAVTLWIISIVVLGKTGSHILGAGWACMVPTFVFGTISGVID